MTPEEKAKELLEKFWIEGLSDRQAEQCALIAVEEVLNSNPTWFIDQMQSTHKYWEDVRAYLNAL